MTKRQEVASVFANWQNPQYIRLHAGEMTAQEIRTVRAVLKAVATEVDLLLIGEYQQSARGS